MTQNQTSAGTKKISTYITMIVVIVLALSIVSLILAVNVYLSSVHQAKRNDDLAAGFLAVIGLVALSMSIFTLYQSRRQVAEMKIEVPKVMTTIECTTKTAMPKQYGNSNAATTSTKNLTLHAKNAQADK